MKVGPRQREFALHKELLYSTSPYFRDRLDATPASLSPSTAKASSGCAGSALPDAPTSTGNGGAILWLSAELPEVFELFVLWLYQRRAFASFIEAAIAEVDPDSCSAALPESSHEASRCTLHWNLVRLHLFAAKSALPALQDASMDALQDLYLRCDWEVSPSFVRFLYADSPGEHAVRLRKWAVAMAAWTIAMQGGEPTDEWQRLLDDLPVLDHDYSSHLRKMAGSRGAKLCIKNPQLRLPANRLRSDERSFGFRQCSFHSHRSAVGERPCPHGEAADAAPTAVDVRKTLAIPSLPSSAPRTRPARRAKDEMESDESDYGIISPVSLYIREGLYLDVS